MSTNYDPDKFEIDKRQLLNIIGAIIKYWKKHTLANFHFIAAAEMVQAGLCITPEAVVKKFWNMLLRVIQQVQFEQTMKQALANNESFAETLDKVTRKIENEGLDWLLKND